MKHVQSLELLVRKSGTESNLVAQLSVPDSINKCHNLWPTVAISVLSCFM